jgi:DNA repair protein RecO (recombination protein O)
VAELTDDVIVTGLVAYGDADVIVRCFSRTRGRLGAFARRARASRKRFPALTAPSTGQARFKESRSELVELLELAVHPRVMELACDLRALGHASYLCELVERLLPQAEPAPEVFAIVDAAFADICTTGPSTRLLRALELKLLMHTGYLPDLTLGHEAISDAARAAAHALVTGQLGALPDIDEAMLREVSRVFKAHLRCHGGPPLKSVQFLQSL